MEEVEQGKKEKEFWNCKGNETYELNNRKYDLRYMNTYGLGPQQKGNEVRSVQVFESANLDTQNKKHVS